MKCTTIQVCAHSINHTLWDFHSALYTFIVCFLGLDSYFVDVMLTITACILRNCSIQTNLNWIDVCKNWCQCFAHKYRFNGCLLCCRYYLKESKGSRRWLIFLEGKCDAFSHQKNFFTNRCVYMWCWTCVTCVSVQEAGTASTKRTVTADTRPWGGSWAHPNGHKPRQVRDANSLSTVVSLLIVSVFAPKDFSYTERHCNAQYGGISPAY